MGMNGGVHDAMNLCEKLIQVVNHQQDASLLDRYERQRRTIAIEYINASTARKKKMLEERDPVARLKSQQELRAIADNPQSAKLYLRKTSMLDASERAEDHSMIKLGISQLSGADKRAQLKKKIRRGHLTVAPGVFE
jgi:3-(3-hydroxy-phenyl)propionate hydroxylase